MSYVLLIFVSTAWFLCEGRVQHFWKSICLLLCLVLRCSIDLHVGCIWGDVFCTYVQKPNIFFVLSDDNTVTYIYRQKIFLWCTNGRRVQPSLGVTHAEVWVLHHFQAKMKRFPSRVSIWVEDICSCSLSVLRISQTLTIKQTFLWSQSSCSLESNDMIFVSAIFTLTECNEWVHCRIWSELLRGYYLAEDKRCSLLECW